MSDIYPSEDEINGCRSGIYLQLKETTKLVEVYGSLYSAIEKLGLNDFIENEVQCCASQMAWVRTMENRLRNEN